MVTKDIISEAEARELFSMSATPLLHIPYSYILIRASPDFIMVVLPSCGSNLLLHTFYRIRDGHFLKACF